MTPKLDPPEFFYVVANPHKLQTKFLLSECNFLTRHGLHKNYVMSRESIPQGSIYVMFLRGGVPELYCVTIASLPGTPFCSEPDTTTFVCSPEGRSPRVAIRKWSLFRAFERPTFFSRSVEKEKGGADPAS